MSKSIQTPQDLVNEWKRIGGLDSTRKLIFNEFIKSKEKESLELNLDNLIPIQLSKPSFSSRPKKDRHQIILRELENKSKILTTSFESIEKKLRDGEKKGDELRLKGEGKKRKKGTIFLGRELEKVLRGSRGEVVSEDEEEEEEEEIIVEEEVVQEVVDVKMEEVDQSNSKEKTPPASTFFASTSSTSATQLTPGVLQFPNISPTFKPTLFSSMALSKPKPLAFGSPLPLPNTSPSNSLIGLPPTLTIPSVSISPVSSVSPLALLLAASETLLEPESKPEVEVAEEVEPSTSAIQEEVVVPVAVTEVAVEELTPIPAEVILEDIVMELLNTAPITQGEEEMKEEEN